MVTLDWIVLGIFFLGLVGIIIWVLKQKEEDTTDYFLAGKNAGWLSIGSSIFASNIGRFHQRNGNGPLGNARMVDSGTWMGICTIL